ncbi:cellulase family glycosylhydrolase [Blautia faecis]|uniref:glycoside hydrolase family 5 protein n=1 Tax=Blautia faecis TaxID=871665 RepID=UPI001654C95C|nr:cellulase family glycosylhydrolase [Blautia faecis]MBC8613339.1 cellulase family glycosylhydrolase [Blautia faecis]
MKKIKGVNLGNWLVLEKWMLPELFEGTGAEDEVWLNRKMNPAELKEKMKEHRDTFITEQDFAFIKEQGIWLLRIPVPYFIFGDRPPFNGCVEYLDKAFDWAEKYGLQILIDLHTVPGSQNGYDNGGLTGVCKWCKNPEEVEFALTVLERLAKRYGQREGLYGLEVLNEPISFLVYATAPSTGKAVDKEEAKGSGYVPLPFLENFYRNAYRRLRKILPENKTIVFHDGFRLRHWGKFFRKEHMKNVVLDTHIYIFAMESFVPIHMPWVYQIYIKSQQRLIERIQRDVPVMVGEWCICNKYAEKAVSGKSAEESSDRSAQADAQDELRKKRYLEIAAMQLQAWESGAGWIYWSYQFKPNRKEPLDEKWKESWDFSRCVENGWIEFKNR